MPDEHRVCWAKRVQRIGVQYSHREHDMSHEEKLKCDATDEPEARDPKASEPKNRYETLPVSFEIL